MDDEKPISVPHGIPEGDVVMQDAPHGDDYGNGFGTGFVVTSSIMTML